MRQAGSIFVTVMRKAVLHTRPLPDYLLALLAQKVPAYGLPVVSRVVRAYDFAFRFAQSRRSKLGDFTRTAQGLVTLTVNMDLGSELFLVTFLHEVAHLEATLNQPRRSQPHGRRWQTCFGNLLKELCLHAEGQMAVPLRDALLAHSIAPSATLHADSRLASLLLPPAGTPDSPIAPDGCAFVEALVTHTAFWYRGRSFLLSGKLSKRHYATEMRSGRLYSFSAQCRVKVLKEETSPARRLLLGRELEPGQEFIHRSRRFRLDSRHRSRILCTDLATGKPVELHGLMHVAI